jgi:KDO2-lipid IV(A) lauroyltransferase
LQRKISSVIERLIYYITAPFFYLVSVLPFPLLHLLSDFLYLVLYKLIGYRKKVVLENMRHSFPGKSEKELQQLCDRFYHHFCDTTLETFKTLTISKENMLRHCSIDAESVAFLNRLADANQNVLLVMGHLGNWEWAGNAFSLQCSRHKLYVLYHPLSSKSFDRLMYGMRSRFGARPINMKDTLREMLRHRSELNATAFIADQSPQPQHAHWMPFLNQDTPVFTGTEKIALKMNLPALYVSLKKTKRSHYTISIRESDMMLPSDYPGPGQLTEAHTRKLEQDILAQPAYWLWTHRRWKHKRKPGTK